MNVLVVIPARLAATRLPRKPLRLVGGAPLVTRVWEHVSALQVAQAVVVRAFMVFGSRFPVPGDSSLSTEN